MKKTYLLLFLLVFVGILSAKEVEPNKARAVAAAFFNTFSESKATPDAAELVYTFTYGRSIEKVYVFNIGHGFVMVSSDDTHRPIVGYSYQGNFDADNISPELTYYIDKMLEGREYLPKVRNNDADEEWEALLGGGSIKRENMREAFFICETLWNQDYPYNYYAPIDNGYRSYAGCVACAMSQVMKFWDSPVRGNGYHEYNYGSFGVQSANFDTTYYDWTNMPNRIYSNSPWDEINAISLLMRHCGVAVDMMYSASGSGAYSEDVPSAMVNYFSFTEDITMRYRDSYNLEQWQDMLRNEFDLGWPVYYSGSQTGGGHAFVCDGYDDNDMFHFNWGWGGSGDGFFAIDHLNVGGYAFNSWQAAIFNMVPRDVYENTPNPPSDFEAISSANTDFDAYVSWVTPTTLRDGSELPNIDKLVLLRNGKPVYEVENAEKGAEMTFTDHVGTPIKVRYEIYVEYDNRRSMKPITSPIIIGPMCEWRIDMTSSVSSGWNKGGIILRNSAFDTISTTTLSSTLNIAHIQVPVGNITLAWKMPDSDNERNIAFTIHDSNDNTIISYNGSINDIPEGTFLSTNNVCEDGAVCDSPITLSISTEDPDVRLDWNDSGAEYGYIIYRDGVLYDFVTQNSYIDTDALSGNHSYSVTSFCSGGESEHSNIVCGSQQQCESPHNFSCTILDNGKIKFQWEKPTNTTGLLGFTIYRRAEGGEYQRLKMLSASATSYSAPTTTMVGRVYQFCITATYNDDCESAPAFIDGSDIINYLEINNTILPLNLHIVSANDVMQIAWNESMIAESYNIYRDGQLLVEGHDTPYYTDNSVEGGHTYCYTVTGNYGNFESGHSNEVCAEFIINGTEEYSNTNISIAPNPTSDYIRISSTREIRDIEISNAIGQVISKISNIGRETSVDMSQYGKGVFMVKVETDKELSISKIVVM